MVVVARKIIVAAPVPVPHHALELGDHWDVAVGRGEGGVE